MSRIRIAVSLIAVIAALDAHAALQRTFVASHGSDSNPCSLTSPCRSFDAAIAQTNANGEVIVLDSAGYGPIAALSKSITITSPAGVYAGISVPGGSDGITINGATVKVVLKGLTINGQGGSVGITITAADTVHVENLVISNMGSHGINQLDGKLYVKDTIIRNNGTHGVFVGNTASANLDRVRLEGNSSGVQVRAGGQAYVQDSVLSGNFYGGAAVVDAATTHATLSITRSLASQNGSGVHAESNFAGLAARISVSECEISGNTTVGVITFQSNGGVTAIGAARNTIARNNAGVQLSGGTILLDGNTITQNAFGVVGNPPGRS